MTKEEYLDTQNKLLLFSEQLEGLDLDEFINRIEQAEAIAPMLNPTLYREGAPRLRIIRRIADSAREVKELRQVLKEVIQQDKKIAGGNEVSDGKMERSQNV